MSGEVDLHPRYEEYWDWVAVALFLFLSVDLLTSMYAASAVGLEHESNPLMAWLLVQPLPVIVAAHGVVLVLAACCFNALFELTRELPASYDRQTALALEAFLGVLVAAGLFVYANNLTIIVLGESLV